MAENSNIEWTDNTFNPIMGCTKVSPACKNCYAERDFDHRYGKVKWGPNGTRVLTSEANWKKPLKWNREAIAGPRPRVFCASLADVFEDWDGPIINSDGRKMLVSYGDGGKHIAYEGQSIYPGGKDWCDMNMDDVRRRLFELIDATPNLDWLLLTKRPENIVRMTPPYFPGGYIPEAGSMNQEHARQNLWLGTSVENKDYLWRIDSLKAAGGLASVLFLSCEPLLGPLPTLGEHLGGIDWVIAGGESGPDSRPSHPDWFRGIRDQCEAHSVPFHFKQWGEWLPIDHALPEHDGAPETHVWRDGPAPDDLPMLTLRVGKKAAGRLLDEETHDGLPFITTNHA